jgi:hypothetical protein
VVDAQVTPATEAVAVDQAVTPATEAVAVDQAVTLATEAAVVDAPAVDTPAEPTGDTESNEA